MLFSLKKKSQVQITSSGRKKTTMPKGMYKDTEVYKLNLRVLRLLKAI